MRPSSTDSWVLKRFPTPVAVAWGEVLRAELHPDAHARFHDVLARTFAAMLLSDVGRQPFRSGLRDRITETLHYGFSANAWWGLIDLLVREMRDNHADRAFLRLAIPWWFRTRGKISNVGREVLEVTGRPGGKGAIDHTRRILQTLDWWDAFEVITAAEVSDPSGDGVRVVSFRGSRLPSPRTQRVALPLVAMCPYLLNPDDGRALDLSPWLTVVRNADTSLALAVVKTADTDGLFGATTSASSVEALIRCNDGLMRVASLSSAIPAPGAIPRLFGTEQLPRRASVGDRDIAARSTRYRRVVHIGDGSLGRVYKARDSEKGDVVAIKVLWRELTNSRAFVDRIRQEADERRTVVHDRLVPATLMEDGGEMILALPLLAGSLASEIGTASWKEADLWKFASDTLEVLVALHEKGIPHGNIKPTNLFRGSDGLVRLTDFGFTQSTHDDFAGRVGRLITAHAYMAPEQAAGLTQCRSDLYSLARVLHDLARGAHLPHESPGESLDGDIGGFVKWLGHHTPAKRPDALPALRYAAKYLGTASAAAPLTDISRHPAIAMRTALENGATFRQVADLMRGADLALPDEAESTWNQLRNRYIRSQWPRLTETLNFADVFAANTGFNRLLVAHKLAKTPVCDPSIIILGDSVDQQLIDLDLVSRADLLECVRPYPGWLDQTRVKEVDFWKAVSRRIGACDEKRLSDAPASLLFSEIEDAVGGLGPHNYRRVGIPKKDGSRRWLDVPNKPLADVQRAIVHTLESRVVFPGHATAFIPRRSAWSHAMHHAGAKAAVVVDIHDFFGSVSSQQVIDGLCSLAGIDFESNGYDRLARILTTTHPSRRFRFLPQGSPSSPFMANAAASLLDGIIQCHLQKSAWSADWRFSRYADDIVISARRGGHHFHADAERLIRSSVKRMRWHVTSYKTRHWSELRGGGALKVCGLLVPRDERGQPTLPRDRQRILRAALHHANEGNFSRQVRGHLAYAYAMTGNHACAAAVSVDIRKSIQSLGRALGMDEHAFLAEWCTYANKNGRG
jgi:serine/threonine protein kinase